MTSTVRSFAVLIMGTDGIAVAQVWQSAEPGPANFDIAIAESTSLLKKASRTGGDLKIGKLRELTISTQNAIFILRFVGQNYFLAMDLSPEERFGRGRLRIALCGTCS